MSLKVITFFVKLVSFVLLLQFSPSFFSSTPGYIFGKRIILFLFLMSLAGIFNYYLILFFGSDFENYIKTITTTISPLLLIP